MMALPIYISTHKRGAFDSIKCKLLSTLNGNGFSSFSEKLPFVFTHFPSLLCSAHIKEVFGHAEVYLRMNILRHRKSSITIKISNPSDCNNFYSKVFFPTWKRFSIKEKCSSDCIRWYSNLNIISWLYWIILLLF